MKDLGGERMSSEFVVVSTAIIFVVIMVMGVLLRLNMDDTKKFETLLLIFIAMLMAYVIGLTYNLYAESAIGWLFTNSMIAISLGVWFLFYWLTKYYLPKHCGDKKNGSANA